MSKATEMIELGLKIRFDFKIHGFTLSAILPYVQGANA